MPDHNPLKKVVTHRNLELLHKKLKKVDLKYKEEVKKLKAGFKGLEKSLLSEIRLLKKSLVKSGVIKK